MHLLRVSVFAISAGLFAQTAPRFELSDVHASSPGMNPFTLVSGGVLRGERYDLRKATMLDLISLACNIDPAVVVGGPNWLEFDRFDIAAKAPARSSAETVRLMLRSLLTDRFKLAVHPDTRRMPAFILEAGKPKLVASDGMSNPQCSYVQQPSGSTALVYSCRNVTMAAFARELRDMARDYLTDSVVDLTGLEGSWDFDLRWDRRSQVPRGGQEHVTIFDAVEKQLGLKLVLRDEPAPVLVIDHVNHEPTANAPDTAKTLPPRQEEFEVADLKIDRSGLNGPWRQTPGGGFEAHNAGLKPLMGFAWDMNTAITDQRFIGLPKEIGAIRVEINARTAAHTNSDPVRGAPYAEDDVRTMLRNLLVERFQIRWHYEDRLIDAWSLVSSGKPKLKKADSGNRASCHDARSIPNDPRDTNPLLSELISCRNVTMSQFATRIQELDPDFAFPVADATGIAGNWDFDINFTPPWLLEGQAGQSQDASEPSGAISIEEAIARQLGLKLEKRKRRLPMVVIEHMELQPIGN